MGGLKVPFFLFIPFSLNFYMKNKPLRLATVSISHYSPRGCGIGSGQRITGEPVQVEVPFTAVGDELEVAVFKNRKRLSQGVIQNTIRSSPQRITPKCHHFGACGGCCWQHLSYEDQLRLKEEKIHALFSPYTTQKTEIFPIIPCTSPWNYRNKMELSFSNDKKGNYYLGLILQGSRGHVFQMEECHLMQPWMMEAVKVVTDWWKSHAIPAYYCAKDEGSLRTLTLREGVRTGDKMIILTVSGNPLYALKEKEVHSFVENLKETFALEASKGQLSIFLRIHQIAKGRPTQFYEILLQGADHLREVLYFSDDQSLLFQVSPSAFFQPNTLQAEKLYKRAIELTHLSKEDTVYDLYCGAATLGIFMSSFVKKVVGIELVPEAVLDARENVKKNALSNIEIFQGDVGMLLPEVLSLYPPQAIMVDPPRSGLDQKAIQHLLEVKAPKLTYISCNPLTQAANLEVLIKEGYCLTSIQPVDQFPQTIHVENIVTLTR